MAVAELDALWTLAIGLFLLSLSAVIVWPDRGIVARWRKARSGTRRVRVEDALKFMHKREARSDSVSLEGVAGALQVSMNETAELLEHMRGSGLLTTEQSHFRLTTGGRESALHIIRAHRLWERYLAEETGFSEEEWHSRADREEHTLSRAATEDLDTHLGHPTFDPHGDPIPTKAGSGPVRHGGKVLTSLRQGATARIVHVEDEPQVVYAQLVADGIHPGLDLQVLDSTPERVRFWAGGREHVLAPIVAANVAAMEVAAEEETEPDEQNMLRLNTLGLGQSGEVVRISAACRGAERRRFLDLGIVPGTVVAAEMRSPGGDPTAYRIKDTLIALREDQARHIGVRPVTGAIAVQQEQTDG